jgi:thiamine transport system substrate-binding protein
VPAFRPPGFIRQSERLDIMKLRFAGIAGSVLVAAGVAAAQEPPTLTVYTYAPFAGEFGPGDVIKANFEAECDCALRWVETEDAGTLLARLLLEGGSTDADVVLGLDTNLIASARDTGLFAPHGVDTGDLDLPIEWTDETFLPFDWGWFSFVYDSEALTDPPTSFAELLAPDGPHIIIQDPRTSTPGLGLLLWLKEIYGDAAAEVWADLAPRIVTVTRGWSEAYGLFLEGEADMVLSYTTSPAYHLAVEGEDRYRAAIFAEGHMLQVEVAAMVANTDQPDLARAFLRFVTTDGFQSAIPEGNWMYPAATPEDGLPTVFDRLERPPISFLMASDEVEANRRAWIDEWLSAMIR